MTQQPNSARFAGRFTEWEPLGEGGEAKLFRVRDRWTGRLAALKVGSKGADAADALLREFSLLSRLRHPCLIVSDDLVRDAGDTGHLLEYVPAVDPRSLWDEGGEAAVWSALVQAMRGIAYLHRASLVHGDVTPGNILVWREGERWRAKVADLGLTVPETEAKHGGVRGTAGFMAPEVVRGEGSLPASDWYSLAATAVTWIDGQGPWEGKSATDLLKTVAGGVDVPLPRRRISPELESLILELGKADPAQRGVADWPELRDSEDSWGPATLQASVSGLEDLLEGWEAWLEEVPVGRVASIVVTGRIGTGRKTAHRAMARALVAKGWTALWDLPLEAMRDWLESVEGDPDPVQLARELNARFAARDVVMLWPERLGELESRLLRAFVTSRDDEELDLKTLVLKVSGLAEEDGHADWLLSTTRAQAVDWQGPSPESLTSIWADLFPPEEFLEKDRPAIRELGTPSAAELLKLAKVDGYEVEELGHGRKAVEREVGRVWRSVSEDTRNALVLMACSDLPWSMQDLTAVLEWNDATRKRVEDELGRTRLTSRSYEGGEGYIGATDWIVRTILEENYCSTQRIDWGSISAAVEESEVHQNDPRLVQVLLEQGHTNPIYVSRVLDLMLAGGRYETALSLRETVKKFSTAIDTRIQDHFLRAAQNMGKYEDEVSLIRELLAESPGAREPELRHQLAYALTSQGDWKGAVHECEVIGKRLSGKEAIGAKLQGAEALWQAGAFSEADRLYENVEKELTDDMTSAWLRFAVGRAREFGQRSDMNAVSEMLRLAVQKAGEKECSNDMLYMHTLGGLQLELGEGAKAKESLKKALSESFRAKDWNNYMMILARSSAAASGVGEMLESYRLDREGLATALATGSDRISGRFYGYLAFTESVMGNIGSALRNLGRYLELAESVDDKNMQIQAHQFYAYIAANIGLKDMLNESLDRINVLTQGMGDGNSAPEVNRYLGIYQLGAGNAQEAIRHFQDDLGWATSLGRLDSQAETRVLSAIVGHRQGQPGALSMIEDVETVLKTGKFPKLKPIVSLVRFEVKDSTGGGVSAAASAIESLWENRRTLDLLEWLPGVIGKFDADLRVEMKKKLLSAVERVAASLDDASMRKQFLSFDKTQRSLRALKQ